MGNMANWNLIFRRTDLTLMCRYWHFGTESFHGNPRTGRKGYRESYEETVKKADIKKIKLMGVVSVCTEMDRKPLVSHGNQEPRWAFNKCIEEDIERGLQAGV